MIGGLEHTFAFVHLFTKQMEDQEPGPQSACRLDRRVTRPGNVIGVVLERHGDRAENQTGCRARFSILASWQR